MTDWRVQQLSELAPAGGSLHVLDLDSVQSASIEQSSLSRDELEQASRYVTPTLRRRYRLAHLFMRQLLANHLATSAQTIEFDENDWGKPSLKLVSELGAADINRTLACHFNLSHSHNLALFGIDPVEPLGVDIELLRRFDDDELRSLARNIMTPLEREALEDLLGKPTSDNSASTAFLTAWTRKEACVKALGLGLSFPVKQLQVGLELDSRQVSLPADSQTGYGRIALQLSSRLLSSTAVYSVALSRSGSN